ncbi:MAG: hypothetical protein AAB151_00060, partial [Nitrospirota bacterium]
KIKARKKKMTKAKIKKSQKSTIEQWAMLSPEEKRKQYLESIPAHVSASMAFEGEHVSLKMLKEYLKSLRTTPQPDVTHVT